jgi:copper(I)-binding protein
MKRSLYLFPLMAFTALSLTLAGCDDNKTDDTAAEQTTGAEESAMPPADTAAPATTTAPEVAATITASNATAYATAEGARTGAVFVTLQNPQTNMDKLLGVTTDKAAVAEIHESYVDEADGTMQMRKVDGVEIPAGQQVELKPGGHHIMLIDLAAPLVEGETFNVTLKFQNAGDVVVPVTITAPGASATDAMGAEMTAPTTTGEHVHDDGSAIAPSTTTDVPVTEGEPATTTDEATPAPTTTDEATPDPTPTDEAVPADEPVTDEQPAQ